MNESTNSSFPRTDRNASEEFILQTPLTRGITLSPDLYNALLNLLVFFSIVIGLPGIVANVLIIVTYTKMGITSSINASYTAMAVSDIGCVVTTIWFEILLLPQLSTAESLPFIPLEILTPTAAYPNLGFAKLTACITAYISLERCLCVASPHKVNLFFTKRLTVTVLVFIGIFNVVPASFYAITHRLVWKSSLFCPNTTVLGIKRIRTPTTVIINYIQFWLYGLVYQWAPAGVTILCSIFLAVYLMAGSRWRATSVQLSNADHKSNPKISKEDRIVKTVLLISVLSIVLSAPVSINFLMALIAPDLFSVFFSMYSLGTVLASFAASMTMLNSCFNLIIYYRMGTKFRATLRQLLNISEDNRLEKCQPIDRDDTPQKDEPVADSDPDNIKGGND